MSLLYLYTYVSYAEVAPLLMFIQAGQAVFLGLRARTVRLFFLALSPIAAGFVLNPALVMERIRYLTTLAGAQVGFVMFVSPRVNVAGFAATILGLRFPYFALNAFDNRWMEAGIAGGLSIYAAVALYRAIRSDRQNWGLCLAIVLAASTVAAWLSNPAKDGPYVIYKAEKAIVYIHFLLIAALILAVAEEHRSVAWRRILTGAYLVLLLANVQLATDVISRFASWGKVYPMIEVAGAVKSFQNGIPIELPEGNGNSSMYWNGVLQYFGVANRYVSPETRKLYPNIYDYRSGGTLWPFPAKRGVIITDTLTTAMVGGGMDTVPKEVEKNPRQDRVLYRVDSFIVYAGAVLQ
jgi:hypothetical protein